MRNMKILIIWKCFSLILIQTNADLVQSLLWRKTSPGHRYETNIVKTTQLSSVCFCGAECHKNPSCVSFNYQGFTGFCELLDWAPYPSDTSGLIPEPSWNHYTFVPRTPIGECPPETYFIPYDIPVFMKYDPAVKGYTCSANYWIQELMDRGYNDCRLTLLYDTEFSSGDSSGWTAISIPYFEALDQCLDYECTGMIYNMESSLCYMKSRTPEEMERNVTARVDTLFWNVVCQ